MSKVTSLRPVLVRCFLLAAAPLAAAAGCQTAPIDPATMADRAALNAREVVHQSGGGVGFTQSNDSDLSKVVSGLGHANDGLKGMAAMIPPVMMSAMSTSPMATAMAGMPTLRTTEEQFDDTADDLKTWLRERVLADANLESKTHDEAVYLLHPDPTCLSIPRAGDPPGQVPALNQKCVDDLTKLQVRVVMTADGDGVRLGLEVGPDKLELSAFIIHSNLLAIESNLPKTYNAVQFVDQTLGNSSPMGGTQLEALTGVVRVSLQKDGEKKVTFAISIPSAIHVATRTSTGGLGPDVHVGADSPTSPTFSLAADGVAQTATATVNLGAIDVLTNWDPRGTGAPPNRDLDVAVGGLWGASTFKEGVKEVVTSGLGVGATSIKVRGNDIFDLDLNPANNRRFDLRASVDQAGEPHFDVTPLFDLSLGFHLGVIASDFNAGSQPASYLLDETYRIRLDNGGATATISTIPASGTFGGGLAVGPGTLTISSTKVADPIVVPAGQCLVSVQNPPPGAHPVLGSIAAAACQ
jgi:hypothetical protein